MKIDIYSSHKNVTSKDLKNKSAVVVDILRSSTTLLTAFSNGLKRFLVVSSPIDAPEYKADLNNDRVIMGGTENHQFITGFDAGDILEDYRPSVVSGKELIYYNADISPAIQKGLHARHLFLGGFLNMTALADTLVQTGDDVAIICAGTGGNFSIEDGLAAGNIVEAIKGLTKNVDLSEYAFLLHNTYNTYKSDLETAIKHSKTYRALEPLGLELDIRHALTHDAYDFVPTLYDNWMTVLR